MFQDWWSSGLWRNRKANSRSKKQACRGKWRHAPVRRSCETLILDEEHTLPDLAEGTHAVNPLLRFSICFASSSPMACLGPRKKKNKSQFLIPDDASVAPRSTAKSVKSRGSTIGSNTTASGTKKTNSVVSTARKTTPAASPRSSLEASNKLAKTTSRASLVSNGRPRSPHTRSPPPPGAAPSARSSARPPSHSRNSSAASSIRKSPVAQMREEFDELKVKVNSPDSILLRYLHGFDTVSVDFDRIMRIYSWLSSKRQNWSNWKSNYYNSRSSNNKYRPRHRHRWHRR